MVGSISDETAVLTSDIQVAAAISADLPGNGGSLCRKEMEKPKFLLEL